MRQMDQKYFTFVLGTVFISGLLLTVMDKQLRTVETPRLHLFGPAESGSGDLAYPFLRQGSRQATAAPAAPPRFSSFSCTGTKHSEDKLANQQRFNEAGCILCRACHFKNVCLNHTSLNIQYYMDETSGPLFHDFNGNAHYLFPSDFVNTGHVHIVPGQMPWVPQLMRGALPTNATFHDAPVTAYVSLNDAVENFGHTLFDFLLPVYNTLSLLGLYQPSFQLLLAKHQGSNPDVAKNFILPQDPDRSLLSLVSNRVALSLDQLSETSRQHKHASGAGLTCFQSLVAGSGSMQATMQRMRVLPFRQAAFANLHVPSALDTSRAPLITMIKKQGRRIVENADNIFDHLKLKFPSAEFKLLQGEAVAKMSIREQLEAMAKTAILITPCGGTGTVLTFLPPGATAIIFNYWHDIKEVSVQMESIYYWNIEYLNLEYFPVLPEDYRYTTDRPQCETSPDNSYFQELGPLVHCNVRLVDIARMESVVQNALRQWRNQHNTDS